MAAFCRFLPVVRRTNLSNILGSSFGKYVDGLLKYIYCHWVDILHLTVNVTCLIYEPIYIPEKILYNILILIHSAFQDF